MSVIDRTYFINDIELPTDNVNRVNKLQQYIDATEKKILIDVLGYSLYKLFAAELPIPTTQRYIDILEGAEFLNTYTNELDKWDGLINAEKKSMLAYFTYYDYVHANNQSESGNGVTSNEFENSMKVNPINKQTEAYNLGVEQYNKLYYFLYSNETTYTEWVFTKKDKVNIFNI